MREDNKYADILYLPHKQSTTRKHMSMRDRAAQFAPFSALSGHDDAIKETARLTNERPELDEYKKAEINEKLKHLLENTDEKPKVFITYFVPDEKKQGGAVIIVSGIVKKIQSYDGIIIMADDTAIPIDDILAIKGEIFGEFDR